MIYKQAPLIALILTFSLFALVAPSGFSTMQNVETILRQTSIVACAAMGMTLVIILGGIDLSVGSLIALSTVVIALCLKNNCPSLCSAITGIMAATFFGLINGLLIARLKILPFITTLGSLLIVRGVAKGLASEQKVDAPLTYLVDLLSQVTKGSWLILPAGVLITIALAFTVSLVLNFTILGKHIYAIGSNENAAHLCGVPVKKVKILVYTLCGFFAGIAGLMQFARLTVGDPTVAMGLELDVIAAVVIGGGSLSGGQGKVSGSLIGALIMTVIRSGCSQLGLPNWLQEILTGTIIIIAVWCDRLRKK
jgi:ribose transport system permease protein